MQDGNIHHKQGCIAIYEPNVSRKYTAIHIIILRNALISSLLF